MKSFDEFADDYREILENSTQEIIGEKSDFFSEYKIKEIYNENFRGGGKTG